ncbi:hypothetical protein FA13DRAFT_342299 [Coprinellus micaceus]|uniref:Uncharacterized protein n=1 Tax=Coprinellus micaceus TaxID=71717 RepID=A0A4Y7SDU7_COPMI|nr:hypothetical protein FA13DRAFT_342299 [Coprinellus micaceus]
MTRDLFRRHASSGHFQYMVSYLRFPAGAKCTGFDSSLRCRTRPSEYPRQRPFGELLLSLDRPADGSRACVRSLPSQRLRLCRHTENDRLCLSSVEIPFVSFAGPRPVVRPGLLVPSIHAERWNIPRDSPGLCRWIPILGNGGLQAMFDSSSRWSQSPSSNVSFESVPRPRQTAESDVLDKRLDRSLSKLGRRELVRMIIGASSTPKARTPSRLSLPSPHSHPEFI